MIAFMGWIDEDDRDVASRASSEALERWIGLGLAFRSAEDGRRYFDLVEVNNFMRRAENVDDFFSKRYVSTLRRLVSDALGSLPHSKYVRRFEVDFRRTFDLRSIPSGTTVRLRAPLPRAGETLYDLDVRPYASNDPNVRIGRSEGRLEARGLAPETRTLSFGAKLRFAAEIQRFAGRLDGPPIDSAPYLREREGLVVVSPRIAALAASVTARARSPLEATRSLWEHMCRELTIGSLHYDQVDAEAPCDWALDSGWLDCRLAASVLVALCRSRGIPARVLGGYVIYPRLTMNHYWAEVWIDERGWLPIDFLGADLSGKEHDSTWRDRLFGTLDYRLTTERLPHEFTGALGVPIPSAWSLLQTSSGEGTHISLLDSGGSALYVDTVRVERSA